MLGWSIKVFILAALLVTLGHFVLEHFNERLNHPKIHQYDASYKKILTVLEANQNEHGIDPPEVSPLVPSINLPEDISIRPESDDIPHNTSSDTTSIENLPVCHEQTMEESLKDFIVNNT